MSYHPVCKTQSTMRRFGITSCVDLWASLRLDKSKMSACTDKAWTIQDELPSPLVQIYWIGRWVTIPFCVTVVKSWRQSPGGTRITCKAPVDIQHCAFDLVAFMIWCVDFDFVICCSSSSPLCAIGQWMFGNQSEPHVVSRKWWIMSMLMNSSKLWLNSSEIFSRMLNNVKWKSSSFRDFS